MQPSILAGRPCAAMQAVRLIHLRFRWQIQDARLKQLTRESRSMWFRSWGLIILMALIQHALVQHQESILQIFFLMAIVYSGRFKEANILKARMTVRLLYHGRAAVP